MYQKYHQHPELIRLIGAAAVSKQFRQTLLRNPRQILEHGFLGYQFSLTVQEARLVRETAADNIQEFSRQVWEWMSYNGDQGGNNGNGSSREKGGRRLDKPQVVLPLEDILASALDTTVQMDVQEEKPPTGPFSSDSTFDPWRGMNMNPLILIVDDNREMAQGLRFALEMEGFQVALAPDGETAIKFLERDHPHLILADIKMPRMDGYALLRVVKQNATWCDIPFVFVTASADWREAVMAKSMGADEYIVKPFELEDLMEVVRRLTDRVEKAEAKQTGHERKTGP